MLLKAIVKGAHGGFHTVADVGRDELTQDLGVDSKRIPAWIMPDSTMAEAGIDPSNRHCLRPAIMFVEMGNNERMRYMAVNTAAPELTRTIMGQARNEVGMRHAIRPQLQKRKIWVEGGYTADIRHHEKIQKKREQHKQLMQALTLRGHDARLMVFTSGVGGSIFQQAKDDLKELGVDTTTSRRVLRDIHLHSVEYVAKTVTQRRNMDRTVFRMHLTARHRQAFVLPIQSSIEDWRDPLACLWLP